jgi:pyruvate decarboxylase
VSSKISSLIAMCGNGVLTGGRLLAQTYYGSIGWATPAALGAELALDQEARENGKPRGRTVLITGDGSLQLTMQE